MTTFIIIVQTCIIAALIVLQVLDRRTAHQERDELLRSNSVERALLLREWRDERTELMNRVQHPQVFQPRPSDVRPQVQTPQDEPSDLADLARVGTVIPGDFLDGDIGA